MSFTIDKKAKKTIRKALKVLGKKNFVFIMHGGSFPAAQGENTGFGTINSNGGKKFIEYAQDLFDAIQMGPAGKTKKSLFTCFLLSSFKILNTLLALSSSEGEFNLETTSTLFT